ncbi:MAG: glycosyltransferase family 87 protein [Corynebacterium sp.]|nr:glycosyltransferase family 87 protein [Corynebacterium sp.]
MATTMTKRLHSFWVARTPLGSEPDFSESRRLPGSTGGIAPSWLTPSIWCAVIVLVIYKVFFVAFNGALTDDFTTVYSAISRAIDGQPVYNQSYHHVDPLYLYNPGATLLLFPLGFVDNFMLARQLFILVNAAAIVGALALLICLMGVRLRSPILPVGVGLAFTTESVTNTLVFSNINGVLFAALVLFYWLFLSGLKSTTLHSGTLRALVGGIVLGIAITIKPQFAPLLLLPFAQLQWACVVAGAGAPILINAVAWSLIPGASDYLTKLGPYLAVPRDYANSSLPGWREYFDLPPAFYSPIWFLTACAVALTVIILLRWRNTDPTLWALSTGSVLLVGVFSLSSLGQQYYSMWLFPLLFTCLLRRSIMHTWPAWLATTFFLIDASWHSDLWPVAGRWIATFLPTVGWVLLIFIAAATTLGWWHFERTQPHPTKQTSDHAYTVLHEQRR